MFSGKDGTHILHLTLRRSREVKVKEGEGIIIVKIKTTLLLTDLKIFLG